MLQAIAAAVSILVAISSGCVAIYKDWRKIQKIRSNCKIIGVPSGVTLPDFCSTFPDFTNYRKAVYSQQPICILHCRTLSRCMRLCDRVCYADGADPKIINLSTPSGIKELKAALDLPEHGRHGEGSCDGNH